MSEKNIKGFEEYLLRVYKRTTKHVLDNNMDLDKSLSAAIEETKDDVVQDFEKEFIAQVLKLIFGK